MDGLFKMMMTIMTIATMIWFIITIIIFWVKKGNEMV